MGYSKNPFQIADGYTRQPKNGNPISPELFDFQFSINILRLVRLTTALDLVLVSQDLIDAVDGAGA